MNDKIFCEYSTELHEYLRTLGQDVSRLDDLVGGGYCITFVGSHFLKADKGWMPGISGVSTKTFGGYVDNGFRAVMTNVFFEKFGGVRYAK